MIYGLMKIMLYMHLWRILKTILMDKFIMIKIEQYKSQQRPNILDIKIIQKHILPTLMLIKT